LKIFFTDLEGEMKTQHHGMKTTLLLSIVSNSKEFISKIKIQNNYTPVCWNAL